MSGAPSWALDAVFMTVVPDRFARVPEPASCPWDPEAFEPWDAPPEPLGYKGGNLRGITERLDEIRALGVNALLLTPLFAGVSYHRYKPLDHFHVDPLLGGDAAFGELLDAAHHRAIRVVLDGVFSHVSVGFPAFQDVLALGPRSPWRKWFKVEGWPVNPFNPAEPPRYACWDNNRSMPELDHGNPAVCEYTLGVIEHWLQRGADGWRFDAPERMTDAGFWREARRRSRAVQPEAFLLGEAWGDASQRLDGSQWDGATNYPLLYALYKFCAGPRVRQECLLPPSRGEPPLDAAGFARAVEHSAVDAHLNFLSSFDVARFLTVAGGDEDSLKLGALLLLTLPGIPCLYYGDEVGMEGGLPPSNRAALVPQSEWRLELREYHRGLIALRHALRPLRRGTYRTLHADGGLVVFERNGEAQSVVVAVNAADEPATASFAASADSLAAEWGSPQLERDARKRQWRLGLKGRSGAILRGS